MLRLLIIVAVAGALFASAFGAASALVVQGGVVQTGQAGTTCQSAPVSVSYNIDYSHPSYPYGVVSSIGVSGIDPVACAGAMIFAQGLNSSNNQIGMIGADYTNPANASKNSDIGAVAVVGGALTSYKIYFGNQGNASMPGALDAQQLNSVLVMLAK